MEPLPLVAAGAGLIVGAVLSWVIRGRRLSRLEQTHAAERRGFEEAAANRQVRIETLEVDSGAVRGELEVSREAMGETEAAWSRDRDVSRDLLTAAEARIDQLTNQLGQLRQQLGDAHRGIDLQKQVNADLEEQLTTLGQQVQVQAEQLQKQQQELAALRQQRDQMVSQLEDSGQLTPTDGSERRRWRISTFFEG